MQEGVEHSERRGICRRGWDIARGVQHEEGVGQCERCKFCRRDGTLREMWNMQKRWNIERGVECGGGDGKMQESVVVSISMRWNRRL